MTDHLLNGSNVVEDAAVVISALGGAFAISRYARRASPTVKAVINKTNGRLVVAARPVVHNPGVLKLDVRREGSVLVTLTPRVEDGDQSKDSENGVQRRAVFVDDDDIRAGETASTSTIFHIGLPLPADLIGWRVSLIVEVPVWHARLHQSKESRDNAVRSWQDMIFIPRPSDSVLYDAEVRDGEKATPKGFDQPR